MPAGEQGKEEEYTGQGDEKICHHSHSYAFLRYIIIQESPSAACGNGNYLPPDGTADNTLKYFPVKKKYDVLSEVRENAEEPGGNLCVHRLWVDQGGYTQQPAEKGG